jgi:hypothetical protein
MNLGSLASIFGLIFVLIFLGLIIGFAVLGSRIKSLRLRDIRESYCQLLWTGH